MYPKGRIMAKGQKDSKPTKDEPKKPLAVKGAEQSVDVKTAEVELEQDELAAFKAAKRAEEEEGISRVIKDVTARKAASAPTISREGFDWEAFERKGFGEGYSTNDRDNMMKLYSGTVATVSNSEVVKGVVVGINNRDVILNIGFKSDGLVPLAEFKDMPNLKIGDEVDLFIEEREMRWVSSCCHAAKPSL
jgi:small subunit ribosomal protein S1